MPDLSRRRFLQAAGLLPLASLVGREALARALAAPADGAFEFFDPHQAAVVREATARLIPGPQDDPLEAGHPGAREANVVRYIDVLLAAFATDPPRIHAGGPWSDRAGGARNHLRSFVPLPPLQERTWRARVAALQRRYLEGIAALDAAAGGDFTAVPPDEQDRILAGAGAFLDLLFTHAIEGMYSIPEYGGNAGLVGWEEISWPGDAQPRGYRPSEVSEPGGADPLLPVGVQAALLARFQEAVAVMLRGRARGR